MRLHVHNVLQTYNTNGETKGSSIYLKYQDSLLSRAMAGLVQPASRRGRGSISNPYLGNRETEAANGIRLLVRIPIEVTSVIFFAQVNVKVTRG